MQEKTRRPKKTNLSGREKPIYIPDKPENVARAIMRKPPKKTWKFLQRKK